MVKKTLNVLYCEIKYAFFLTIYMFGSVLAKLLLGTQWKTMHPVILQQLPLPEGQ